MSPPFALFLQKLYERTRSVNGTIAPLEKGFNQTASHLQICFSLALPPFVEYSKLEAAWRLPT